jgi:GT2 family glycosyltransferase
MPAEKLDVVVGIATVGRREVLAQTLSILARQTRLPDHLVICPVTDEDVDSSSLRNFPRPSLVVRGAIGLPAQRNKILSTALNADVIVFLDDDFLVDSYYIENVERIFVTRPDVTALTGSLLVDGARGPGLSVEEGLRIIQSAPKPSGPERELVECYGTYGCNMAFRLKSIIDNGILFDENLPLYGWQEDIDFSLRVLPYGKIMKSASLRGVHLGIKHGRTSGVRFGYSQIANPIYLVRKGSMSWRHANKLMWRNLGANLARSLRPEPWIDRKGRLKGNFLAFADVARGRISPSRILQLD